MQSVTDWQHPFVDVFKRYNTYECPKSYKGSVSIIHDPAIARKCFKLSGSILSNNTVTIPDPNGQVKHCNLTGRYLYIELFASPQKYFCAHFEIGIKDREPGVRFTVTNMEKQYTVSGGNTLKIPACHNQPRNLWTILCIDIEHHLQNFGLFSKGVIRNYTGIHIVKGIQLCSNMTVRGIYTSDIVYDWDSLPKEMCFKVVKGGRWSQNYNFVYMPENIDPAETRKKLRQQQSGSSQPRDLQSIIVEREQPSETRHPQPLSRNPIPIPKQSSSPLPSLPFLTLTSTFSFTSLHNPDLLFLNSSILYYSSGSILISRNLNNGQMNFLKGHTDYIVAMDSVDNWIVTVQQGVKSGVRVWIQEKCVCSFQCPYDKVQQVRLSKDRKLGMVGLDGYKRQVLLVFDISQIQITRKPVLVAKQVSDFNILCIKFSPVQGDKLVSCGKENIRFWRIKNQHLPGSPVILNHHARNTIFTVLDFEYNYTDPNPLKQHSSVKRVYVGSQTGLLFQINYQTHQLQEVYKLHDNAAISSIVVSAGFCITGGQDQLLRVWQMDFNEYIMEAGKDGVVTSLVLSQDAGLVACGTSTGTLSILDLSNSNLNVIVRSHTAEVTQLIYHQFSNCMITLSQDLTIRLWDPIKMEQTYQFSYFPNDPCTCISGNPKGMSFAAGFQSGVLRVFDIENTCMLQEIKHHQNPICYIQYSPDGRFLAVLEEKISMLYSPLHSHQPVKHLPIEIPSKYKHCSFGEDSESLAVIGDSGTHINLWELRGVQLIGKIFAGKPLKKLKFQSQQKIWAIFQDTSIRRYNTSKLTIQVQMQALHRQSLNAIAFDLESHLLFTVGDDSFVKVWDYSFMREQHQVQIGHADKINDVVLRDGKLWTAGSEGILVWQFRGGERFVPPPVFGREKKAKFVGNDAVARKDRDGLRIGHQSQIREQQSNEKPQKSHQKRLQEKEDFGETIMVKQQQVQQPRQQRIVFSNLMRKAGNDQDLNSRFQPQRIEMNFPPKLTTFRKVKKRQAKPRLTSAIPQLNIEHNLPLKHFFQQQTLPEQLSYPQKIQLLKQNSNKHYKLQYLVGLESYAHDHVVWNFMYGWYAYIYDNLVVVESLNKARSQKIITMPQKLGCLALTKDYKRLLCSSQFNPTKKQKGDLQSSDSGSQVSGSDSGNNESQASCANIYVLSGDFSIQKKLEFHPKGIQCMSISSSNKYLVSIGNFRQCTVCVWDLQFGKLKASSYTLDKLNDIAILNSKASNQRGGEGRLLEFATVGRDQIHFWAYTKEEKLEYYDVFVQKDDEDSEKLPQLTSCDFVDYEDQPYLVCGTTSGDVLLVRYADFKTTWKKNICSAQITSIKSYTTRCVIASADGSLFFWDFTANILHSQPNPSFNKLNLQYTINSIHFDPEGIQGVVGTSQGIYYVNLNEKFNSLLVGSAPAKINFIKTICQNQFMLTSHENGRVKLWNTDTCEELKTYKWRYPCTEAYFDDGLGKVVCFCQNQSVKLVNVKKFTKEDNYMPEELLKGDSKLDDYVIFTTMVTFGGKPARWVFFKKGSVHSFEIGQEGKKKVLRMDKVLDLNKSLQDIQAFPQKNILIAVSTGDTVSCYNVDLNAQNGFSLLMVDQADYEQFHMQAKNNKTIREDMSDPSRRLNIAVSKVLNQTYLAISEDSQYVYFRNYMKRLNFQRILLGGIPASIYLQESKRDSDVILGMKEGGIVTINAIDPDRRSRYEGIVNNSVEKLMVVKGKNWLAAGYPNALAFYAME